MTSKSLTLVLDDAAAAFAQPMMQADWPEVLKKVLQKARFKPDEVGATAQRLQLFSKHALSGKDVPAAALRGGDLCIDPCYLHADRDKLLLFHHDLNLTEEEADGFIALIQPLVDEWGVIQQHNAKQWHLSFTSLTPKINFTTMDRLQAQPVTDALPAGEEAIEWIRLWNEIQMVLFDCEINQARESRGELPVNGVWFWGQGKLPELTAWPHISGQKECIEVLLKRSGSNYIDVSTFAEINYFPALHIENVNRLALSQWCEAWLQPALKKLKWYQLRQVTLLVPGWGEYTLNPWQAWRCA